MIHKLHRSSKHLFCSLSAADITMQSQLNLALDSSGNQKKMRDNIQLIGDFRNSYQKQDVEWASSCSFEYHLSSLHLMIEFEFLIKHRRGQPWVQSNLWMIKLVANQAFKSSFSWKINLLPYYCSCILTRSDIHAIC